MTTPISLQPPYGTLRIASRESALALWQSEHIKARLEALYPGLTVQIVGMTTKGDRILDVPLAKIGGKGLFVKEMEQSLLAHETDIAVHSMKDVPMEFPPGLQLAAICQREDPFDAFVSNRYKTLGELPQGACVGTSSLRRQCQLLALRPDLQIKSLRGNVNTRLAKLDNGEFDAIVLATSGLKRLGFAARIASRTDQELLPAVGQGALGIECRSDDARTLALLAPLIAPYDSEAIDVKAILLPPSSIHWMGTDALGRDALSRMLFGARISLLVGFVAVGIATAIGVVLGALAGYYRGWTDTVIMRLVDVMLSIPTFFLILAVIAFLTPSIWNIMIVIGLTSWMGVTRLVRAEFLSLREREFIVSSDNNKPAAKSLIQHLA